MEVKKQETQNLSWDGVELMNANALLDNKLIKTFQAHKKTNPGVNVLNIEDEDFLEFVHKVTGEMIVHLRKERGFRSSEEIELAKVSHIEYDDLGLPYSNVGGW